MIYYLVLAGLNAAAVNTEGLVISVLAAAYEGALFLQAASVGGYKKRVDIVMAAVFTGIMLIPLYI